MVVIADDCAACRSFIIHQGSYVICDYSGNATARRVFETEWGAAYVIDCPVGDAQDLRLRCG